jgi:hypothetical protein
MAESTSREVEQMAKRVLIVQTVVLAAALFLRSRAQQAPAAVRVDALKFLVGKWVGEGTAETGQAGQGYCSFEPGLQDKVLVRKNHPEYPPANGRPAIVHDDLMIIYPDREKHELRAFYTDNEGNVINYTVRAATDGKSAVFLGDAEPGMRRFRLTYSVRQPGHMTIRFEMAPAGQPDQFQKFIEGKLRRSEEAS